MTAVRAIYYGEVHETNKTDPLAPEFDAVSG